MQNGLYKVQFQTQLGEGSGVVTLRDGSIGGGDSLIYYVGTYAENGSNFEAKVTTGRHSNIAGMTSVFGIDKVTITLRGTTSGDSAEITGTAAEAPKVSFKARLTRLA